MSKLKLDALKVTSFITNIHQNKIRGGDFGDCETIEICETGPNCIITHNQFHGTGGCCAAPAPITTPLTGII